jgi:glycogen debranching enzyme
VIIVKNWYGRVLESKSGDQSIRPLEKEIELLKSPKGYLYAGFPKFKALFGRDSMITGWELMEWDKGIAISAITALANLQGKRINLETGERPGKIPHEHFDSYLVYKRRKGDVPWLTKMTNYFSVDSTPLFIIVSCLLYDLYPKFISSKIRNAIINSLEFMEYETRSSGMLSYVKSEPGKGPQSQSWRDGIGDILDRLKSPITTVGAQGYLFDAVNRGIGFLKSPKVECGQLEGELKELASGLPERLENYFWDEDYSYYALAFDGDGVAERAITSDPGHLLFSGVLTRRREREVIDGLLDSDMLTDFGIRTLSSKDHRFDARAYQRGSIWPHDNWIIAIGLKKRGYVKQYEEIRDRLLNAYEEMGRMPEYFGVDREGKLLLTERMRIRPCYPQSWSTGAIISLMVEKDGKSGRRLEVKRNGNKT